MTVPEPVDVELPVDVEMALGVGRPLGVERLCVFALPPVPLVHLAADLGCRWISSNLEPMRGFNPRGYPGWSLAGDGGLRRKVVEALTDRQVGISLGEGFVVGRHSNAEEHGRYLDVYSELGCSRINVTSTGRDYHLSVDGLGRVAELAATYGVDVVIEVGSGAMTTVTTAVQALREVSRPNLRLLLDTMHFFRLGSTLVDLQTVAPELIGYVQLCDVPAVSAFATYMEEALWARLPPGDGDLPLAEFLRLIPESVVVGLEIPQRARLEAGEEPIDVVRSSVAAARRLFIDVDASS